MPTKKECERQILFGLPVHKTFHGKTFSREDYYTDKSAALSAAGKYKKKGYLTRIVKLPLKQERPVCWKYALYVRATPTAVGRVIKRGKA